MTAPKYFFEPRVSARTIKELPALEESLLRVQPESLVVSAVKRAETSNDIILRLFNPTGMQVQGKIQLSFEPSSVSIVNLLEEFQQSVMHGSYEFDFTINPAQIMTFLVSPKRFAV